MTRNWTSRATVEKWVKELERIAENKWLDMRITPNIEKLIKELKS